LRIFVLILLFLPSSILASQNQIWPIGEVEHTSTVLENGTVITCIQAKYFERNTYLKVSSNLSERFNDFVKKSTQEHHWKLVSSLEKVSWKDFSCSDAKMSVKLVLRREGCCKKLNESVWEFDTSIPKELSPYYFDFRYYLYRKVEIILPEGSEVINCSIQPHTKYTEGGKVHLVYEFPDKPLTENIKVTYLLRYTTPPPTSESPPSIPPMPITFPSISSMLLIVGSIFLFLFVLWSISYYKKESFWEELGRIKLLLTVISSLISIELVIYGLITGNLPHIEIGGIAGLLAWILILFGRGKE